MKVVDQVPMPRVRQPQVTPQDFEALALRIEALEAIIQGSDPVEKKRGRPAKDKDNGNSDE